MYKGGFRVNFIITEKYGSVLAVNFKQIYTSFLDNRLYL